VQNVHAVPKLDTIVLLQIALIFWLAFSLVQTSDREGTYIYLRVATEFNAMYGERVFDAIDENGLYYNLTKNLPIVVWLYAALVLRLKRRIVLLQLSKSESNIYAVEKLIVRGDIQKDVVCRTTDSTIDVCVWSSLRKHPFVLLVVVPYSGMFGVMYQSPTAINAVDLLMKLCFVLLAVNY